MVGLIKKFPPRYTPDESILEPKIYVDHVSHGLHRIKKKETKLKCLFLILKIKQLNPLVYGYEVLNQDALADLAG